VDACEFLSTSINYDNIIVELITRLIVLIPVSVADRNSVQSAKSLLLIHFPPSTFYFLLNSEVPMLIAVTGGTGFVGRAVVSELLGRGHEVRILARKAPAKPPGDNLSYYKGSVVTGEGLDPFVKGADAVIHLVGIIREAGTNTFDAVHSRGTMRVVETALRHNVQRYVHMSALGTRENAVSTYHQTKWAGEEAVRASGLAWTIFRPSIIFGQGDEFINMLAGVMRLSPVMPVIGGGKNLMQPVAVSDVAASFRSAVESMEHRSRIYELGGPDVLDFKTILKTTAKVIGIKRIFIPFPMFLIKPPVTVLQAMGLPLPVTTDQLSMLSEDNIRKGGDPVEDLGIEWTPFEQGIREYLVPSA
jgi:NADH dehydrogenase